jgi:hypothetical protein
LHQSPSGRAGLCVPEPDNLGKRNAQERALGGLKLGEAHASRRPILEAFGEEMATFEKVMREHYVLQRSS